MEKAIEILKNQNLSAEEKYEYLLDLGMDLEDIFDLAMQE